MNQQPIGLEWLKRHYKLAKFTLTHSSFIGSNHAIELTSKGNVEQTFGSKYQVSENTPLHHIEFSLKYDDLNLDLLKAILQRIQETQVEEFINAAPAGKYVRRIGFLYEFLTHKSLSLSRPSSGNYADLLDEDKYVTGNIVKNAKWRINDNLLGAAEYCPVVRKTKELKELLSIDLQQKIRDLKSKYSQEVFRRAISYLYYRETRSSYEIEKEEPSPQRMERFIALLTNAGTSRNEELVSKERLILLQKTILDPRFAAETFRDFQNFVGESLPNFNEHIHYVCPPPGILSDLMQGLWQMTIRTEKINAEIRAGLISFGFVFIHPFGDGNGRLHRFLIHDALAHDNLVPQGLIIPVSAHMLNHIRDYDHILEKYSRPLMQRIRYNREADGSIGVTNEEEVEAYFRYPDLTDQCVYLIRIIHATLQEDMPEELLFIQRYDEAKRELQNIVDMPDKDLGLMLTFFHQNGGIFPKRRRDRFSKITDTEIMRMQTAFRKVFEMDPL